MAVEILNDQTRKYGRNLTAAAVVILVFYWVPGIEISEFELFGFVIGEAAGSELSIWYLLTGILVYYFVRFSVSLRIDSLANWRFIAGHYSNLETQKKNLKEGIVLKDTQAIAVAKRQISDLRSGGAQVWQFYILEAGMPLALFAFAAITASIEIIALLPPDTPSSP